MNLEDDRLVAMALLLSSIAAAQPVFVAEHAEDALIARAAWEAAVECTGREGRAHDSVEIVRGFVPADLLGRASHDRDGLYRIELADNPSRRSEIIFHEVAHAWITEGPPALTEGRTELLADCAAAARPGMAPLQWDVGGELTAMPHLLAWSRDSDHGPATLGDARTDAYLASARLVRMAALLLPERALWPEEGMSWHTFTELLEGAGEPGQTLAAIVYADRDTQMHALSDRDLDGLPQAAEALLGTADGDWDSDGDGWWDGMPRLGIPVPLDGTPVCSGYAAGPAGAQVRLQVGGNLRGEDLPMPRVRTGEGPTSGPVAVVPAGSSILVELDGELEGASGGMSVELVGSGFVPDASCVGSHGATVWSATAERASLVPELADRVAKASAEAEQRWGVVPGRLAVVVGTSRSAVVDGVVQLSEEDVGRAVQSERLEWLAQLAVSLHRVWQQGDPDWRLAEALARSLERGS